MEISNQRNKNSRIKTPVLTVEKKENLWKLENANYLPREVHLQFAYKSDR